MRADEKGKGGRRGGGAEEKGGKESEGGRAGSGGEGVKKTEIGEGRRGDKGKRRQSARGAGSGG